MKKELTPKMVHTYYLIRDGHYHVVDLTSAKALERRGIVRIRYAGRSKRTGKVLLRLGRPYELLVHDLTAWEASQ